MLNLDLFGVAGTAVTRRYPDVPGPLIGSRFTAREDLVVNPSATTVNGEDLLTWVRIENQAIFELPAESFL